MMDKCRNLPEGAWKSYSQWQQTLVAKNRRTDQTSPAARAEAQQRLLAAAANSASALATMLRGALGLSGGDTLEVPLLRSPLTAADLRASQQPGMPAAAKATQRWEQMLHESLSSPQNAAPATRSEAAQVLFWVACSVAWLESGGLENPPAQMYTEQRFGPIAHVGPNALDNKQRHLLDNASRDVLRALGGIPHVRSGHNNHLLDCPTARAWWRIEMAQQAQSNSDGELSFTDCYEIFLQRGCWRAWTTTAMTMAGRLSTGRCAAGFASAIRTHETRHGAWPDGARAREIASNIVRRSASFYAGMLDHRTLARLAE
ncbi:hypothetical protein [Candidatus Poriferisodalis sp.]|uniref:hypothetical protein n=1 Tax=Candidatus Poriferisodalis sp. TaxID=3101277 RepID=UPI003D0E2D11